jgi:hypothetical protein
LGCGLESKRQARYIPSLGVLTRVGLPPEGPGDIVAGMRSPTTQGEELALNQRNNSSSKAHNFAAVIAKHPSKPRA